MIAFLSQIVFMQPIILSALLALPVIWYILRITPPAPKTIFFPATRFLHGLVSEEQTPSKSPWWILLLRLLLAALIIIAMANPVINPADSIPGYGPVRIIIDNSWASAQTWDEQLDSAEESITQAAREGREIYITPTTAALGETKIRQSGPLSEADALSIIRGLTPNPWPADYTILKETLENNRIRKSIHSIWLSHGLDEGNIREALAIAQNQGSLSYITPPTERLPLILRPSANAAQKNDDTDKPKISIDVDTVRNAAINTPVTVRAMADKNDILDVGSDTLSHEDLPLTISFDILEDLISKIARFEISGRRGAGGLFLLDDQYKKRKVGIAAAADAESSAPLIEASYYIKRALEPFSQIIIADPVKLIEEDKVSVLILPDVGAMPTDTLNTIENWVKEGGLLLRFSGPNLADSGNEQFLLPVMLRSGGRSLSGSLSWDAPQNIATFTEQSPYYGLTIPDDISIKQQVLADPEQDLDQKVWARLSDGTPFITARQQDKGLIVLIHTTANTDWSNFCLSGLYVSVLKRTVSLAGTSAVTASRNFTTLDPILIMDGYGGLMPPPAAVPPLSADKIDNFIPNSLNPPGIYGNGQTQYAFNLGVNLSPLLAPTSLPTGILTTQYEKEYEISIMPYLLYAALGLFLIDWIIMIIIAGSGALLLRKISYASLILLAFIPLSTAQADETSDITYAGAFYLAYIETGDTELDNLTRRGLESLSATLHKRTSVEPEGIAKLNPETDTLSFFPLIYWAISDRQKVYSDKVMQNIQSYLDHGGTIIFDTRDQNRSTSSMVNTDNAKALRRITASLNIPPIIPVPDDHVLGRAFYLLDEYPGRYSSGTLWVERYSASGRDNVSSVLIGSNDWVGSWADSMGERSFSRFNNSPDSRQREMAMRFGVNLVMYALTGNYKADQVHIPHILERLDR
jgi:hypothetical protein